MGLENRLVWEAPFAADRIDLTEDADLAFWTDKFSCNALELFNAIQKVGIGVEAVQAYLVSQRVELAPL